MFFKGQALNDNYEKELEKLEMQSLPWHKRMMIKYRRLIGMAIPALFFHFFWLAYFIKFDLWHMFSTDSNYRISIMAIFGSLIAGKSKRADLIIN